MNRRDLLKGFLALCAAPAAAAAIPTLDEAPANNGAWFSGWADQSGNARHFIWVEFDQRTGQPRTYLNNREVGPSEVQALCGQLQQMASGTKNAARARQRLYNHGNGCEWEALTPAEREDFGCTSFFDLRVPSW